MMKEIKVVLYRHKTEKDIYLARNWSYCGGGSDTEFYYATKDINTALKDASKGDFMSWYKNIPTLKAKITLEKQMDFDGYAGTLKKTAIFPVSDFEKVLLVEIRKEANDGR